MEEENKQSELPEGEPLAANEPIRGSGSLLAAARQQQKKTVEEIADNLNLSISQIKNIESDQTEGLPEATYVRGYIRSYSKLLGLEPEEVLKNYLNPNWQQSKSLIDMPSGIGELEEPRSETGKLLRGFGLLAIILVLGTGIFYFMGFELSSTKRETAPIQSTIDSNDTVTDIEASEEVSLSQSSADLTDQATLDVNTQALSETVATHNLIFNFQETSWVDIRDINNNRLAYQSYAQGEELRVNSESNLTVFLGNAAGVSVIYNGSNFDISNYTQGVYAKFSIGN